MNEKGCIPVGVRLVKAEAKCDVNFKECLDLLKALENTKSFLDVGEVLSGVRVNIELLTIDIKNSTHNVIFESTTNAGVRGVRVRVSTPEQTMCVATVHSLCHAASIAYTFLHGGRE